MADDRQPSLGHELRTHMTTVKGYAQFLVRLLRRDDLPREGILSHAEELERQVRALERTSVSIIDDSERSPSP